MIDSLFIELNAPLLYTAVAVFSLAVGSLLNVIIYRLPLMLHADLLSECRCLLSLETVAEPKINLFFPRSFCPSCKTRLKAWHNIPVLSYLLLRGRCQQCKTRIPFRYPFVEIITCLLSVYACWHFGFNVSLVFALLFIWIIIALFFIDADHQLLPDCLTLPLLWLGLFANTQSLFTSLPYAVFSAAGAWLFLWLFIKLFYLITGKIGMGNGDFKLFAAFGAWFGWTQLPLILLLSSTFGAIAGLVMLKWQNKDTSTPIAFGPFLCLFGLVSLFWGQQMIHWYLGYLQ